jgi:hypothetical protein
MWTRRVAALCVVMAVVAPGAAAAGGDIEYGGSLVVVPDEVAPGELTTVSNAPGSECPGALVVGNITVRPGAWSVAPDASGNWSIDLEIPPNGQPDAMGNPTPFPPGEYEVFAHCYIVCPEGFEPFCAEDLSTTAVSGQLSDFEYEPASLTVDAAPPDVPTDPPSSAPPEAEAAAAAAAQPTVAG